MTPFRLVLLLATFAIVSLEAVVPVSFQAPGAQAPAGGRGGRGGAGQGAPARLDIATATRVGDAAQAAAAVAGLRIAVAVVDANGDLVYFRRMDRAAGQALTSAEGKARSAILFNRWTRDVVAAVVADVPVSTTLTPAAAGPSAVILQQGGVPIRREGRLIGAIGVAGSTPAADEHIAAAGASAIQ